MIAAGNGRTAGFGLCAALCLFAATQAQAGSQYVVVAAEPPADEYREGMVLDVGDTIVVRAGTVVTLLGEDGSVSAIPGPASVTVTEEAVQATGESGEETRDEKRSTISKLAELLSGEKKNADSLGVARSVDTRAKSGGLSDPWVVSVHRDGPGCVRDAEIRLGRNNSEKTVSIGLAGDDPDAEVVLLWPRGTSEFAVPETVSTEEATLIVNFEGKAAKIDLKRLPDDVNRKNPVDVLGWMLNSGCRGQALAFTKRLAIEAR